MCFTRAIENIVEEVADPDDLIADFVANPLMFGKSKLRLCGCGELNQPIECT